MDIQNQLKQLKAARTELKKQSQIAHVLSVQLAEDVKLHIKSHGLTIAEVSMASGVPYPQLVNLFWGNSTHLLTADIVAKVWKAAIPNEKRKQRIKYTFKLSQLPREDWKESNKVLAKRVGCCQSSVSQYRRKLFSPKIVK